MELSIAIMSAIIAAVSALIAFFQTKAAKEAIMQASLLDLFGTFDRANDATLQNPDLLYEVHGLPRNIDKEEARRIAYLSLLLDGFQHYYGRLYNGDFSAMEHDLKRKSVFLNRIVGVERNKERWEQLKAIYYGDEDFDLKFKKAIDNLFIHELSKKQNQ